MRSRDQIAADILQCAVTHAPASRLIGNVTAMEIAALVVPLLIVCPKCGAEAWVNIDCDLCAVGRGYEETRREPDAAGGPAAPLTRPTRACGLCGKSGHDWRRCSR
jgi:hypothetical protein